jgi:hypothetical protein
LVVSLILQFDKLFALGILLQFNVLLLLNQFEILFLQAKEYVCQLIWVIEWLHRIYPIFIR